MTRKALRLAFLATLFCCSFTAQAMWAKLSNQELIQGSPSIVRARLLGITQIRLTPASDALRLGVLQVQRVYKGPTQTVLLLRLPSDSSIKSSTDLDYSVGQEGIWFLRQSDQDSGIYLADHPQRFWQNDQEDHLLQELERR